MTTFVDVRLDEPLRDVTAASLFLDSSKTTVYRMAKRGELPYVRIGGRVMFEPQALRDFVAERRSA